MTRPAGALFKRKWLEKDAYPQVFAYYYKLWTDYSMNFHTHDSIEIMYVIQGQCRIELALADRSGPAAFLLKKGEFIVLDGGVPHRLLVEAGTSCRMLNVEFEFAGRPGGMPFPSLRQLAKEDPLVAELAAETSPYLVLRDSEELYPLLKSLVLELDRREKRRRVRLELLFAQLLVTVAHIRGESAQRGAGPADRYVKEAIRYLHHNYDRDIRVKDVASAVNVHPGYLHRLFTASCCKPINAYLTEIRMEKAKMLLRQTDIPVADICDYVGVSSRQYFHAMFRKYANQTPIEYRQSHQTQLLDGRGAAAAQSGDDF